MMDGVICFVGLGSNMDDPAGHCLKAMHLISEADGVNLLRSSSLYRTEPVGCVEQDWFINAVAEIRTELTAHKLMKVLQDIENNMGRVRKEKWGPRIIDLDILLYGQDVIRDENLVIPHPGLHRRRFILIPLCEIASYVIHPAFGVSIRGLMDRLDDEGIVEKYGNVEASWLTCSA
ncbi:MAG: 2-amino-4-hydroxy-6-hydroxymethyldihydropteridine diphosphokinase [Deltaproteobacteria bacterium]